MERGKRLLIDFDVHHTRNAIQQNSPVPAQVLTPLTGPDEEVVDDWTQLAD